MVRELFCWNFTWNMHRKVNMTQDMAKDILLNQYICCIYTWALKFHHEYPLRIRNFHQRGQGQEGDIVLYIVYHMDSSIDSVDMFFFFIWIFFIIFMVVLLHLCTYMSQIHCFYCVHKILQSIGSSDFKISLTRHKGIWFVGKKVLFYQQWLIIT